MKPALVMHLTRVVSTKTTMGIDNCKNQGWNAMAKFAAHIFRFDEDQKLLF